VRDQWPDLYYVLVTDNPESERSCFQVFSVKDEPVASSLRNLHEVPAFDIYFSTVREYQDLVTAIFGFLATYDRADVS